MSERSAFLNEAETQLTLWAGLAPRREQIRGFLGRDAGNRALAATYASRTEAEQKWLAELRARLLTQAQVKEVKDDLATLERAESFLKKMAGPLAAALEELGIDSTPVHRLAVSLGPQHVEGALLAIRRAAAKDTLPSGKRSVQLKRPGGRPRAKAVTVNERMAAMLQADPTRMGWAASEWAAQLSSDLKRNVSAAVKQTATWKMQIMGARALNDAKRATRRR